MSKLSKAKIQSSNDNKVHIGLTKNKNKLNA